MFLKEVPTPAKKKKITLTINDEEKLKAIRETIDIVPPRATIL